MIITREDLDAGRVDLSDLVDPEAEPIGPIHPGEVLREDFLAELDMSAYALAKALNVPLTRIAAIVNGERAITADTALRLARYFGTTPAFWLGLQAVYDLEVTKADHGAQIEREVHPRAA